MARVGRQTDTPTASFQVSLDEHAISLIDMLAQTGRFGRNRPEIAARVLRDWLRVNALSEYKLHEEEQQFLKLKGAERRPEKDDADG